MHNATSFATEIRMATEAMLDAVASTDSIRRSLLRQARGLLDRAVKAADIPEENAVVDALSDLWETLGDLS